MGERQNTFVCAFEPQSHRISTFEIHEWINEKIVFIGIRSSVDKSRRS